MKRVLAVLVLTLTGLLMSSVLVAPDTAQAGEPEVLGLLIPDLRDDTVLETLGKPDDDSDGDPDSLTGGFGMDAAMDVVNDLDSSAVPDGISTWHDLFIYLAKSYWVF